jgi:glycosyltransferase involved in cell wall biosynthesis
MNIIVIGPVYPFRGGIAHTTTLLSSALSQRYHTQVISFRRQYPGWLYPGQSDRDPSQQPLRINAEYLLDPLYPWTWWQTAAVIAHQKPDLVIIQWWTTFWAPAYAVMGSLLRRKGVKLIFLVHNVLPHETRVWDKWLARLALGQGQGFLVLTGRERDRLHALMPGASACVIALPVFPICTGETISREEARRRLNLPEGMPVALFFGLVRPYKGLRYLIEAIARLRDQGRMVYLVVAGEFWEDKGAYQHQIKTLGLANQVRIEDRYIPNEEVGLYFSAADVFVAPYVEGTQSAVVKVALGFDIPIVISQAISSPELVADTALRLYWVPPKDAEALAGAIASSLCETTQARNPSRMEDMTQNWDEIVEAIEAMV